MNSKTKTKKGTGLVVLLALLGGGWYFTRNNQSRADSDAAIGLNPAGDPYSGGYYGYGGYGGGGGGGGDGDSNGSGSGGGGESKANEPAVSVQEELDSYDAVPMEVDGEIAPDSYMINPGGLGTPMFSIGDAALAAGAPVYGSASEVPEGSKGVVPYELYGETYPLLVEKYKGNIISQPLGIQNVPSAGSIAVTNQSTKQLLDAIDTLGINRNTPEGRKQIGQLDREIRLANSAALGVPWSETHKPISEVREVMRQSRAQLWVRDIDSFKAQGGIISHSEEMAIRNIAAGKTVAQSATAAAAKTSMTNVAGKSPVVSGTDYKGNRVTGTYHLEGDKFVWDNPDWNPPTAAAKTNVTKVTGKSPVASGTDYKGNRVTGTYHLEGGKVVWDNPAWNPPAAAKDSSSLNSAISGVAQNQLKNATTALAKNPQNQGAVANYVTAAAEAGSATQKNVATKLATAPATKPSAPSLFLTPPGKKPSASSLFLGPSGNKPSAPVKSATVPAPKAIVPVSSKTSTATAKAIAPAAKTSPQAARLQASTVPEAARREAAKYGSLF